MAAPSRRATTPFAAIALTVTVLLVLSGMTGAFSLQRAAAAPPPPQQAWWNPQYAYRQSISIANPASSPVSNLPVFLQVSFPFTHVSDASAELRLVSQSGAEVPSYVLDEVSSQGYVVSAWLLAFVSAPASSLTTFELYYGNPSATIPAYRIDAATAKAQAGGLSLSTPATEPGSPSFTVTLGGTYEEQVLSKVAYASGPPSGYGAPEIAQAPAPVVSPLSFVANVSSSVVALSSVYSAGALRYSQALVLDNGTLLVARLLTNTAATALNGAAFTDVVDASGLAALGPTSTSYASGLFSTGIAGAYFGYESSSTPSSFEVGDSAGVISDAGSGGLRDTLSATGTAGALTWNVGSIAPGASAQLVSAWGYGRTYGQLIASLSQDLAQVKATEGQEESYSATPPEVTSSWDVAIPLSNATISGAGFSVPISLGGATAVASRLTIAGTVGYVLPAGYSFTSGQKGWTPQATQSGNASAYATTGFYSVQEETYTDSVRVTSVSGAGSGVAQLVSPVMSFPGSVSKDFIVRYKAAFSGTGDLSGQWLYAAVDASAGPDGPFAQTVVAPAAGTSNSTTGSGCGSLLLNGVPSSPQGATVSTSGSLVADGSWRTLNVSLDASFGTSAMYARMRFCVATAPGYAGQLELDIAQAGVQAKGDASSFLSASLPQGGGALALSFIPGAAYEPSSLTFDGVVSFPTVASAALKWDGSTAYNGTIEGLLPGLPSPVANATLVGATLSPPSFAPTPKILVNGTSVVGQPVGNLFFLKASQILGSGAPGFRAVDVALTFPGHELTVSVRDADGRPLPDAGITVQNSLSAPTNESFTGGDGSSSLSLLPAAYNVSVYYQGVSVGSATANLASDQKVTITTSVYSVPLQVKNALSWPVAGADVSVKGPSASFNLTTDSSGKASFLAVPDREYNVSASIGGESYYAGTVLGSPSRGTFEIGTSYLQPSLQVAILAGVALSMLVASLAVYLSRRHPKVSGEAAPTIVLSPS